jgi:hypothetical protein
MEDILKQLQWKLLLVWKILLIVLIVGLFRYLSHRCEGFYGGICFAAGLMVYVPFFVGIETAGVAIFAQQKKRLHAVVAVLSSVLFLTFGYVFTGVYSMVSDTQVMNKAYEDCIIAAGNHEDFKKYCLTYKPH